VPDMPAVLGGVRGRWSELCQNFIVGDEGVKEVLELSDSLLGATMFTPERNSFFISPHSRPLVGENPVEAT
jgi:hypothetical protein